MYLSLFYYNITVHQYKIHMCTIIKFRCLWYFSSFQSSKSLDKYHHFTHIYIIKVYLSRYKTKICFMKIGIDSQVLNVQIVACGLLVFLHPRPYTCEVCLHTTLMSPHWRPTLRSDHLVKAVITESLHWEHIASLCL